MVRTAKRGFTLVEILIVVIILGILAAIVIPQFTNASDDARKSSMSSTLQSLRSQLSVYKLEHTNGFPPQASDDFWTALTTKTDLDGTPNSTAADAKGPYFDSAVKNPITNSSVVGTTADANTGWVYNANTGEIHGVAKDPADASAYIISDDGINTAPFTAPN